jgi:hypothetical protein
MAVANKRGGKVGGLTPEDIVERLFNSPNTAIGLGYGSVGQAVGPSPKRP